MNPKLKFRHELKYYVNAHQYTIIRQRLKNLMTLDANADSSGDYHIRSLYFDDINNKALYEKLSGVRNRAKYRIRIYNNSDSVIHLEKKIKNDNFIAKVKERLTRDEFEAALSGDYERFYQPDKPLYLEMFYEMKNKLLRPKVVVDYAREAYITRTGNVRITFDKELRTGLNALDIFDKNLPTVRAIDEGFTILEVKYDEYLPEYIRLALQLDGLRRETASKYVICRKFIKENSWEDQ